jgi:hypothetical protein
MVTMTVVAVVLSMMMMAGRTGISATLGVKRRRDLDDLRTKLARHVGDHVVAADAQGVRQKLRRQVPVA